ncbi:transposase [Streptomyces sp. NPDC058335]|uniref:transposase n=1 Tax=Streptomyces sp. NPDC058335 TaxID=3346451 RepID=UPI00364B9414
MPEPKTATPRVLGADDFALRKGNNYSRILIDIETHQPIDLLPDRTTSTVARWLAEHPQRRGDLQRPLHGVCRGRTARRPERHPRRGVTSL